MFKLSESQKIRAISQPIEEIIDLQSLYTGDIEHRIRRFIRLPEGQGKRVEQAYQATLHNSKNAYFNYLNPIVNYYSSFLFSEPLIISDRELPEFYKNLKSNCDHQNTDLHDFFRDRLVSTLVTGFGAFEIKVPQLKKQPENREEWLNLGGNDLYLSPIDSAKIYDFQILNGELQWLKIRDDITVQNHPLDEKCTFETYKIFTKSHIEIYQVNGQNVALVSKHKHGFDQVPFELLSIPVGYQLGRKLKDPQVSLLKNRIKRNVNSSVGSFPILHIAGPLDQEENKGLSGSEVFTESNGKADFVTPSDDVIKSLLDEEKNDRSELYRIANLVCQGLDQSSYQLVRSGYSRMLDASTGVVYMKSLAHYVRESISRTLKMIAQYREDDSSIFRISGFEHLESLPVETLMKAKEKLPELTHSKTANNEIEKRIISKLLPDLSEDKRSLIYKEIDTHVTAPVTSNGTANDK